MTPYQPPQPDGPPQEPSSRPEGHNTPLYHPTSGTRPSAQQCHLPPELRNHFRYEVLGLLGVGGMGCVYQARHRFMDRLVALKLINPSLLERPGMVARFLQEVRAAAHLSHPSIVRAYDADQVGDTYFLVMEFVVGENLDQVVDREGPLPIDQACDFARQTALGLQHAFQHGMVHRDIKPHNLMRTPEDQIKILDFGLAHYVTEVAGLTALPEEALPGVAPQALPMTPVQRQPRDRLLASELVYSYPGVGTPDYIAPEEILDPRHADIRADIYSLGCTLYRLLTRCVPFPVESVQKKLRGHLKRVPEPLSRLRPEIAPELAALVERMMAKERARRFQTPAEVARALGAFVRETRQHILVVDDDSATRNAIHLTLENEGYGVSSAANGREALEQLQNGSRPDLILLDIMMPVMDGWQLLYALKGDPILERIPVMVLSAHRKGRGRAAALGVADFLEKPLPLEELAWKVNRQMGESA